MLSKIQDKAYHLKLYRKGESDNFPVIITIIIEIQNMLFSKCTDSLCLKVNNTFYEKIDDELEKIRAITYGIEPELRDHYPVVCFYHNNENFDESFENLSVPCDNYNPESFK